MTGLTFTPCAAIKGREIASLGSRIVGMIVPDGRGKGGWVWWAARDAPGLAGPRKVATREDARKIIKDTAR
jgi:hypothetical protein